MSDLRAIERMAMKIAERRSALDALVMARNEAMLRACDVDGESIEAIAGASGLTVQRVNQVFAEMSK